MRTAGWFAAIAAVSALGLVAPATASAGAGDLVPGYGVGGIQPTNEDEPAEAGREDLGQDQLPIGTQPSGKPILAGRVVTYGCSTGPCIYQYPYVVERLGTDGTLDPSFGSGGITSIDDLGHPIVADQSILQPDGKTLVVGPTSRFDTSTLVVIRLDANGALDATFDDDGVAEIPTPDGSYVSASRVAVLPDGRIVAAIDIEDYATYESTVTIAALNEDGSVDASFGSNGYVAEPEGRYSYLESLLADSQGRVLVTDVRNDPTSTAFQKDPVVNRYLPDGSRDSTYGVSGEAALPGESRGAGSEALTPSDGVVRLTTYDSGESARITSVTPGGTFDRSFGDNGFANLAPGITTAQGRPQTPRIQALAVQGDGSILVAGGQHFLGGSLLTLGRLLADGSVDSSFGDNGYSKIYATPRIDSAGVLEIPGQRILLAGGTPGAKIVSAKYRSDAGSFDDADADRVGDSRDACPDRFAAGGCPHHRVQLTLDLSGGGRVGNGVLSSSDPRCLFRVTVGIFVKVPGRDPRIGHRVIYRGNVGAGEATYSVRLPRSPIGPRYARVRRSQNPAIGICRGVRAPASSAG